ncbi:insulinase family protein [Aestuariibacter halophilus]|uniref:Protease 3 n=1 Tax=Fluctibacter halophilus TaxID=226011 RepID=A0ABS8G654_9ALTE|nr:insulinase family protein [Aestuariibacter halophilus]MCC2615174.1 insulinase family protein [Aestuariibacter halophilus]
MLTSNNDPRQYRHIVLNNGLEVVVIHDAHANKSAASMTIGAGHFYDPEDTQGLAHLLEHMLFLGNEHFPQANGFDALVSAHGGHVNAWTGTEFANFHFDLSNEAFELGLAQLAAMLMTPLFDAERLSKEIQAIDAEFKLKLKDDLRRLYQVHKETCNPAHPFSKFSVGNLETLAKDDIETLQNKLRAFHQRHYVASNMKLCLLTAQSLDTVSEWVHRLFAALPDSTFIRHTDWPPLYLPEQLGINIAIKPIVQARRLIISFALSEIESSYRSKPVALLSHIIGDEGPGSLLEHFKASNWATSLSAGGGIQGHNFKDFNLNLQLTEEGLQHVDDIIECVFAYLALLDKHIDEPWRYDEKVRLNQLALEFGEHGKAIDEVAHIAEQLFTVSAEHVLVADCLLDQPDIPLVRYFLSQMNPDNMRIKLIDPDANCDKHARWYNTPYRVSPLSDEQRQRFRHPRTVDTLCLPRKNPYLVERTTCIEQEPQHGSPHQLIDTSGMALWFAQDHDFGLPKGDCYVSFDNATTAASLSLTTAKKVWVALQMESLTQRYYQAAIAGLNFHLYAHQAGFSLHTSGFADKQLGFHQQLLNDLRQLNTTPLAFEQIKRRHLQALKNSLLNKPINRLFTRLSVLLQRNSYAPADLLPEVERLQLADIQQVHEQLFSASFIESFVHGDWSSHEANAFGQSLQQDWDGVATGQRVPRDVVDLRAQHRYVHEVDCQQDDAAAVVYYQPPGQSLKDVALTIIAEQLVTAPFFHHIRTEKQLGYLVGSGYMPFNQHPGLALYIQSPVADAWTLQMEIKQFVRECLQDPRQFVDIWPKVQESVYRQLLESDTTLSMKSQRLWMAIGNPQLSFERQNELAEAVRSLTFDDITRYCEHLLSDEQFGELVLYCRGNKQLASPIEGQSITDIRAFKSNARYML